MRGVKAVSFFSEYFSLNIENFALRRTYVYFQIKFINANQRNRSRRGLPLGQLKLSAATPAYEDAGINFICSRSPQRRGRQSQTPAGQITRFCCVEKWCCSHL